MKAAEKAAALDDRHRRRVVHGWAFRDLPAKEVRQIRAYLDGGSVPEGYEQVDAALGGLPSGRSRPS